MISRHPLFGEPKLGFTFKSNELTLMHKLLLVDDEPDVLEFLSFNLGSAGFEVYTVPNGLKAIEFLVAQTVDLIIMDVMMPGMDGFTAFKKIKENPNLKNIKLLFLTASDDDNIQIGALDLGADDFISKPIRPKVLLSRVNAILRREIVQNSTGEISFGDIKINKEEHTVKLKNKSLDFVKKEFNLLLFLALHPNKVFTREELLKEIWGEDIIVGSRTIDVHIRKIREKLGEEYIKTIKGIGYKLEI